MTALQHIARAAALSALVALLVLPAGCAVDGGYGYGPNVSVGVGLDYYEPFGFDYGGWGRGYNVGPPRGGGPHFGGPGRGWHPPPPGHAMPSIPTGPRSRGRRPAGGERR
jgi:hypothetical protein